MQTEPYYQIWSKIRKILGTERIFGILLWSYSLRRRSPLYPDMFGAIKA